MSPVPAAATSSTQSIQLLDVLIAGLVASLAIAEVAAADVAPAEREPDFVAYGLVVVGGTTLLWRRRWPVPVLATVVAVMVAFWVAGYPSLLAVLGLPPIYAVAIHCADRRLAWGAVAGAAAVILVAAAVTVLRTADGFDFFNLANVTAYVAGAIVAGAVIGNRERIFANTQHRADRAEADRLAEAKRAVTRERRRIAREMHDVVSHSMSVIAVQSAAAQEVARTHPDRAADVLARIEAISRESLTEMRHMLGVLRDGDDEPASLAPQPALGDLGPVIDQCAASGINTELVVTGHRRELPAGIDLAAFRIIQESLTNVIKHAGPPASCTVCLHYGTDSLQIDVTDDGRGGGASHPPPPDAAKGLIGMRERAGIYGGELSAGPVATGGFRVCSVLPLHDYGHRPTEGSTP